MFIDACGLILADDKNLHLGELTRQRAFAAVPFAGRYRLIDFPLSNMINTGLIRVGVATSNKYESLMDHLGTGSSWDLDRKNQGLRILPPYLSSDNYFNNGDDLNGVLDFLLNSKNEYALVSTANNVFSSDYEDMINEHIESGADITVLFNNDRPEDGRNLILDLDQNNKVRDVYLNPEHTRLQTNSLGVVFLQKELLVQIITEAISRGISKLSIEMILRKCEELDVRGYEYEGRVLRINSVKSYYKASMETLNPDVNNDIFWSSNTVYTKVKDEAPAYIYPDKNVTNSLVADGCLVNADVVNSILFRRVEVGENTKSKNSIIGQGSRIGENVVLENIITDKDCCITDGTVLKGDLNHPLVIGKGEVV